MRLKRIEAPSVGEAMRRLRQELGDDAVILHTKTIGGGPGMAGLLGRSRVEILGAVDEPMGSGAAPTTAALPPAAPAAAPVAAAAALPVAAPDHHDADAGRVLIPAARPAPAEARAEIAARLARFQAAVPTIRLAAEKPEPAAPPDAAGVEPRRSSMTCLRPEWDRLPDRARRIAFVGPTGAGKTTTLAKAAARAQLDYGRRVHLVTIDTYRIGAVPQLSSYADILGVAFDVAHTPEELGRALERARGADLVFIDTVGRSPVGPGLEGLVPFMEVAAADDVLLTVSVTTRVADALRAAARFGRLHPNRLCVTKLDETDYHAGIPVLSESTGLPLTWLTNGQSVPDDLEEAEPGRIASLVAASAAA
jgi:flagellar biosynthesis protein FlhF